VEPNALGLLHAFVSMVIAVGYLMVPLMILPYLSLSRGLQTLGMVGSLTGAISFASMVLRVEHTVFIVIVDAVFAVTLIWFVIWCWIQMRADGARDRP
jgi:hypothetical protein